MSERVERDALQGWDEYARNEATCQSVGEETYKQGLRDLCKVLREERDKAFNAGIEAAAREAERSYRAGGYFIAMGIRALSKPVAAPGREKP